MQGRTINLHLLPPDPDPQSYSSGSDSETECGVSSGKLDVSTLQFLIQPNSLARPLTLWSPK